MLWWWLWSGRTPAAIGVGVPGGWASWIGLGAVAALTVALGYQVAVVRGSAEAQAQVRKQFRGVPALIVPRDKLERRMWIGLSLTAGFCEEVLYRGFLIWYVMTWLPGAAVVFVSAQARGQLEEAGSRAASSAGSTTGCCGRSALSDSVWEGLSRFAGDLGHDPVSFWRVINDTGPSGEDRPQKSEHTGSRHNESCGGNRR